MRCSIRLRFSSDKILTVGAPIVGRISDRAVVKWREKRGGVWYPEDRLRAGLLPLALYAPIPLILFGLANKYVDGTPGLVICLICLFANGVGVSSPKH